MMQRFGIAALCAVSLVSCGDRYVKTGVFLDTAVENLRYETEEVSGYTDAFGTFKYRPHETVSFYLGDVLLGSHKGDDALTPLNITDDDDITGNRTTNIAVLLQSLDVDQDLSNGILIPDTAHSQVPGDLNSLLEGDPETFRDGNGPIMEYVRSITGSLQMVTVYQARAHLESTLENIASNLNPTSSAGEDQSVVAGDVVELQGGVSDADGLVVDFQWEQIDSSGFNVTLEPVNESISDNEKSASLTVQFTAPDVTSTVSLTFRLNVTDEKGAEGFDEVTIQVAPAI